MKNNILVKRQVEGGCYEFVTLRINYIQKEDNGFTPHISWKVDNGNGWHFESLTQFLSETFEHFLKRNNMERVER